MAKFNERGEELENKEAVEMPLKFKRPLSIHEMIARAVQAESWSQKMREEGRETFEEANDFEVGDDVEPDSQYEVADDSDFAERERELLERAGKELEQEKLKREKRKEVKEPEGKEDADDEVDEGGKE